MLFLGIDQQARHLTVSLRDQNGDVILARQGSTQPEKILDFFDHLTRCCAQRAECGWAREVVRAKRGVTLKREMDARLFYEARNVPYRRQEAKRGADEPASQN